MSALAFLPLVVALASPETAKLFSDKGSVYFRTDKNKALVVGAELVAVADPSSEKEVGKAVIMELSGKLARVSLDDDAAKASAKFVVLPKARGVAGAAKPTGPKLTGTLESGPLRVTISNNSDTNWSGCELGYSDGSTYKLGEVVKHSDDTVLKVKFRSAPEPLYDHLVVSCAEGESRFYFSKPTAPVGKLKGYAVNEGRGGDVVVYNSSDSAWTRCDVKKPDRSHYVLGTLKGHDDDSINGSRFKKEAEPPISWIEVRCREGWLRQPL